ncbi:MAG: biopolymer transporter ExbD [Polyangiaceae bacterium]|nr:biopolymer transporter ExbD [Polyangiaceae bacterium]MCW5789480.1 biopolymer transporter ExbD [Polyangiaceae bacterium]
MAFHVASGPSKHGNPPAVNITPLVDVALVVLIIFMIVAPMMTKTFWLNIPKKDTENTPPPQNQPEPPLVLTLTPKGEVKLNQTVVPKSELTARLPRVLASRRSQVVYFDAHDGASYAEAVEVMDLARQGGARSIAMLTQRVAE